MHLKKKCSKIYLIPLSHSACYWQDQSGMWDSFHENNLFPSSRAEVPCRCQSPLWLCLYQLGLRGSTLAKTNTHLACEGSFSCGVMRTEGRFLTLEREPHLLNSGSAWVKGFFPSAAWVRRECSPVALLVQCRCWARLSSPRLLLKDVLPPPSLCPVLPKLAWWFSCSSLGKELLSQLLVWTPLGLKPGPNVFGWT